MSRAVAVASAGTPSAILEVPTAEPAPGQVRVRVEAAAVNGIDVMVAAGHLWAVLPHEFPVVLGRNLAGTVEALGADVSGIRIGDRVAGVITSMTWGAGAIAERVTVEADSLAVVPAATAAVQAAAAVAAGTTAA